MSNFPCVPLANTHPCTKRIGAIAHNTMLCWARKGANSDGPPWWHADMRQWPSQDIISSIPRHSTYWPRLYVTLYIFTVTLNFLMRRKSTRLKWRSFISNRHKPRSIVLYTALVSLSHNFFADQRYHERLHIFSLRYLDSTFKTKSCVPSSG